MHLRSDFIDIYSIGSWDRGDQGLPIDLFPKGQRLTVTPDGDFGCRLAWNGPGDQPCLLELLWTPLWGGALAGSMVELKGAGTLLVDAGVVLQQGRLLQGTLRSSTVTGGPGTFAAQAPPPPG